MREAKAANTDPIDAARRAGDGYRLFSGRVSSFDWGDRDGFLAGHLFVEGRGEFAGQTLRLDYKNEHLVAQLGDRIIATCPDLITMVDRETAEGVNNPEFYEGQLVEVLGFRCDPIWRRPEGLEVFEPRYFGFPIDYTPIEDIVSR